MALSEGAKIAIGVCVPIGAILLGVAIFFIWFKFIRVKTATFKVSYVDENGVVRNEEVNGDSEEVKEGQMTAETTTNEMTADGSTNGNHTGGGGTVVTVPMSSSVGVPVFSNPTHTVANNGGNNNNLRTQQSGSTTTKTTTTTKTVTTRNPALPFMPQQQQTRITSAGFNNNNNNGMRSGMPRSAH